MAPVAKPVAAEELHIELVAGIGCIDGVLGGEHEAAVGGGDDTGCLMDGKCHVVVTMRRGQAGVHSDPYADRSVSTPPRAGLDSAPPSR